MRRIARNVVFGLVLVIAACRVAPIYNVESSSFNSPQPLTLTQAGEAIQRAGTSLGWSVKEVRPGVMQGTLNIRDHRAVVDILYDTEAFSINYANSDNLKYDGTQIHKNYNSWVQNLEQQIRVEAGEV